MSTLKLTAEQANATNAINAFLRSPRQQTFTLHGLAGTGKTTVLAHIAKQNDDAILCTLTGKAASVLRDKTGLPACTVHSAFYRLDQVSRKNGKRTLHWSKRHDDGDKSGEVILLDECSMIDHRIASDLLATGAKVVACGDPGQLPPVKGDQFFCAADARLNTIHRQALESPIIRQAHAVRETGRYEADGEFRTSRIATDDDLLAYDIVLTWTHKTRRAANAECRRLRGMWMPNPQIGEPVMCLRNAPQHGIFNGAVYELAQTFRDMDDEIVIAVDGAPVCIPRATFPGVRTRVAEDADDAIPFDFGYSMTVHKAQGSEWPSVILMDEFRGVDADRRKWLYTGITRAASRVLVVH